MKKYISLLFITILIATAFSGCNIGNKPFDSEAFVMNTFVTQHIYGKNKKIAAENVNKILSDIEKQLSLYIEGSEIDKINKSAGKSPVKVNDYTYDLIKTAKIYCEKSDGKFDITIAPLSLLWDITSQNPKVPSQEEIDRVLPLINYQNIILDDKNKTVMLKYEGMAIDLGGIAKGYIVNLIKEEYEKQKIDSALVSIGGNIFTYKDKPDKTLYKLGLKEPTINSDNSIFGKISVKDKVVATSGYYERYFEKDSILYHHILDPKTGYPAKTDILSATVICKDGGMADFLSTTLFILGTEKINSYINNELFEVVIVDKNKNVYVSKSLKPYFELTNKEYKLLEITE